ncbi:MAG TPA: oligosaccharide flippase family protein [Gemmataceae bacterium]|jgi:O-antigen/teichoic acid export membrane protein|nr:oligosaccharide flippase family protein [Gemmataceae bacterium]
MSRVLAAGRRFLHGLSTDVRAGLSGLGWSYLTHFLQLVIRLISSKILTHLLVPEAYGVFGTALSVLFFLEFLSDIGLRPAVVRSSRGEDPLFLGTAWSVVMVRAVGLTVVAFALAWVLPIVYEGKYPELGLVLLVLCARPLWLSLQNPTIYVLYRRLNYRIPFYLDILQTLFAVPVTILLAIWLRNVWAMVLGLIIGDIVRILLSHLLCPLAPKLHWDKTAVHEMTHFGVPIFVNTLTYGGWFYFDRLVGPRLLSGDQMGLFFFAWNLYEAMDNLVGRGSEVFYSMLSRKAEGDERSDFFRRTTRRLSLFLMPILALGAIVIPWAFKLYYTAPEFRASALLLGVLTARLIMRATSQVQFMYLMMRGEVILATRAYVVSLAILAATFALWVQTFGFGVLGIALSSVLAMTTFTLVQTAQMVYRRQTSPWPALIALGWTTIAVLGVLALHGEGAFPE